MIGARPDRRPADGFTLVELLVAMTLIGLIFIALFGGLRFGARTWEVGNARSEISTQIEVTQSLLRRQLAQAFVLPGPDRDDFTFEGETERLRFTAPGPSQVGLGGIYLFELFTDRSEQGQRLVLKWRLYRPDLDPDSPVEDEERKTRVLLDGVAALRLAYFGDPEEDENPQWRETWSGYDLMPELISIRLDLPQDDIRRWPDLFVAPKARSSVALP